MVRLSARTHTATANGPHELRLVVIANSRGVAREVGAGDGAPWADEDSAPGEQHARHRPILRIGSRVAPGAGADVNQVFAEARSRRCIRGQRGGCTSGRQSVTGCSARARFGSGWCTAGMLRRNTMMDARSSSVR